MSHSNRQVVLRVQMATNKEKSLLIVSFALLAALREVKTYFSEQQLTTIHDTPLGDP